MMKQSFWGRALTIIGAAAVAVPLALGLGGHTAHAAASDTTAPTTQKVTLTKFAFSKDQTPSGTDPTQAPNTDGKQTLEGAEFTIYDVTSQYWADEDRGDEAKIATKVRGTSWQTAGTQVGDPITTNQAGQATADLSEFSNGKPAVYLFVETKTPAGYKASVNFVLTLPVTNKDGKIVDNVYVYPKDSISPDKDHYRLKFKKVDKYNQQTGLSGAKFYITRVANDETRYARVIENGTFQARVTGFQGFTADDQVAWVGDTSSATTFISDSDGLFGFAAASESRMTKTAGTADGEPAAIYGLREPNENDDVAYSYIEAAAPAGYQNDHAKNNSTFDAVVATSKNADAVDETVTDTPQGLLPHTGGAGIVLYVVIGVALIALGVVVYRKRRA